MNEEQVICEIAEKCECTYCGHNIPHRHVRPNCSLICGYTNDYTKCILYPYYDIQNDNGIDIQKQFDELIGDL